MKIRRAGIVLNPKKKDAFRVTGQLTRWLRQRKIEVIDDRSFPREQIPGKVDLVIVLGGDGTLLNVAPHVVSSAHNPPVIGINLGGLGFLTEITAAEVWRRLEEVLTGKATISSRMMLAVKVEKKNSSRSYPALNDVVISKGARARIINLEVSIGKNFLCSYLCDGLIVSTATGSTGHSLSAGGPVVDPAVEAILINPICAHTLSQRPLLVSGRKTLFVRTAADSEGGEVAVMIDGQTGIELEPGDCVRVSRFPRPLRLITSPEGSYFQLLRQKLGWGVRHPGEKSKPSGRRV